MKNILMLDLEGVLIATSIPPLIRRIKHDYGLRPYARPFVCEALQLFDEVYLNTCVREEKALEIMRVVFAVEDIGYYRWDKKSRYGKAVGYEQFSKDNLIHVEDGSYENKEAKRILELGFTYISVPTWKPGDAFIRNIVSDNELVIAMNEIKKYLK